MPQSGNFAYWRNYLTGLVELLIISTLLNFWENTTVTLFLRSQE